LEVGSDSWCKVAVLSFLFFFFFGRGDAWRWGATCCDSKKILGTLTDEVVAEIANGNDSDISFV